MRIAASSRSSIRSTGRSSSISRAVTSGNCRRNSLTIGSTCSRPNRMGAVILSSPRGTLPCPAAACSISVRSASTRRAPPRKRAPASVRLTARVVRLSSRTPSRASRSATARVTAAGERSSRRAAAVKLPWPATSANTAISSIRSILFRISEQYLADNAYYANRTPPLYSRPRSEAMSNSDLVFPPAVRRAQAERGTAQAYAKKIEHGFPNAVTPELAAFIAEQDTAFLATASAEGAPYVQHRGGPKGFIKVVDERTLGFADYRGNNQFITLGNLSENDHAYLFVLDFSRRQRIKLWGRAR